MINNRQGGRRRGRGGQQPRGIASNNSGNRQDNRQRGNAAQLLEKYKSMARDSQLAGDRVQTEYYLQFADHYFRVLGESRSRFDDQRRQRGDDDGDNDEDGDDRMDVDMDGDNDDGDLDDQQPQQQQPQRNRSDEQPQRSRARPGNDRSTSDRPAADRSPSDRPASDRSEPRSSRSNGRPRDEEDGRARSSRESDDERIDFAVLPPAIGSDVGDGRDPSFEREEEEAPRPRRRARRPQADEAGGDDAAAS